MDRANVLVKVRNIIADNLNVGVSKVVEAANLVNDLGLDSIDGTTLVMAVEEEFKIETTNEEVGSIRTVKEIVDLIMKKTAGR
ncbi:acyl carrier protein [Xanthomonas sp. WHRI 1810A]|uniref:acyl carrier protein n=1 Tax=Xanthomonas sp. WHRI 1810A TaxID=3161565 RepID=UPI0032E894DD